jgi:tripartite-type tricarboxylate transporter receptor subunit TctC
MLMDFWIGFAAPAGTPQPVIDRLNKEVVAALSAPATKKRLAELGLDRSAARPDRPRS